MKILLTIMSLGSFSLIAQNPFEDFQIIKTNLNNETCSESQDAFFRDGLIISANYKTKEDSLITGETPYKCYYVERHDKTTFSDPQLIKFKTDEIQLNQASFLTFDDQGNCVFCADDGKRNGMRYSYISLFQGEIEYDSIHSIRKIELGMDSLNCLQPSLSKDGKMLFFVAGNSPNFNIYYSKKKRGSWSTAMLLNEINSEHIEMSPIIVNDTTLVFSSNRPGGHGGLDLYYSTKSKNGWSQPINLGSNINSEKDEFRLIMDISFNTGYLTSNKKGTDDIYLIKK